MEAPYLIINGKKAKIGQQYWTVSMADQKIAKHTAGSENNVIHLCYFDNEEEAVKYQRMAQLLLVLSPQVRCIEKMHQGDGFRRADPDYYCKT